MSQSRPETLTLVIAKLLTGLLFAFSTVSLHSQVAGASSLSYSVSEETTLSGTVLAVLPGPDRGMIMGSHLLVATVAGRVDVSLGRWGLRGNGALSVAVGQQVTVTGVARVLRDKPVFLARTVKANEKVYAIRNEYGIPVSPQARERAAQKGESR